MPDFARLPYCVSLRSRSANGQNRTECPELDNPDLNRQFALVSEMEQLLDPIWVYGYFIPACDHARRVCSQAIQGSE